MLPFWDKFFCLFWGANHYLCSKTFVCPWWVLEKVSLTDVPIVVLTPSELTLQKILKFFLWNIGRFFHSLISIIPLLAQMSEIFSWLKKTSCSLEGIILILVTEIPLHNIKEVLWQRLKISADKMAFVTSLRCIFLALEYSTRPKFLRLSCNFFTRPYLILSLL